jgi:arogenate/prephenate dehydratase
MRTSPITVVDPSSGDVGGQVLRFSYLFYVDLVASTADVNTQNALRHLQEMSPFLRVLGCYQIANGRTTPPSK